MNWVSRDKAIIKDVLRVSVPVIGEQLLTLAVVVVDTMMVGHLGSAQLAAMSISIQWLFIASMLSMAISMGSTILVAQAVGARDWDAAKRTVRQSMLLSLAAGLAAMVLTLLLAEPIITVMGGRPEVVTYGVRYLYFTAGGVLFSGLLMVSNASLRGAGETRSVLLIVAVVNVVTIAVAWTTINGLFGLPKMGMVGSALGMSVGQVVGGLLALFILFRGRGGLKLDLRNLRLDLSLIGRILRIGLPVGVDGLFMRLGMTAFLRIVAGFGTVALAANAVVARVESLSFAPCLAFAVAGTTLVGQGLGARDPERAEKSGYYAYAIGGSWMTLMGLIFVLFPRSLTSIFTSDPAVIEMAVAPLRIIGFVQPLLAAAQVFRGNLAGAGDTRFPVIVSCVGSLIMLAPVTFGLGVGLGLGLVGAWLARAIDVTVGGIILFLRFRRGRWKETKV